MRILFAKTLSPELKSSERFALEVLNEPKYDHIPQYIDKNKIQKVFDEYGYKLSPFNDISYTIGMNPPNIEGHFIAQHLPEIESIVIDGNCDKKKMKEILDKNNDITHIGLSTYAIGLDNAISIINMIKQNYPEKIIYLGGIGTLYPQLNKLISKSNICYGCGINWLREKLNLPPLNHINFKIPYIKSFGTEFISNTNYLVSQIGCPNKCDFCSTAVFLKYNPFTSVSKIINFLDKLRSSSQNDIFLYICEPNAFFPEQIWMKVFEYYINTCNKRDNYIFMICLTSLSHLKKFNIRKLQEKSALKLFIVNFGIESTLYGGYKKNYGITNEFINELNNNGIITYHNFILGLPHHDRKSIEMEINRNLEYDSAFFSINTLKPIPKTSIYKTLKEENRLFGYDLPVEFFYQDGFFPFEHPHLGKGFDALEFAFKAYYEAEKKTKNSYLDFIEILSKSPIFETSTKLKKIAKMFLKMSNIYFPSFKLRMSKNNISSYESKLTNINSLF